MRDFPSLKLLDRFKKLFIRFGIDYPVMRKILQVKLLMDRRRVPTVFSQNNNQAGSIQKEKNHYLSSLWIYVLFGLFLIPFTVIGDHFLFQMSLVYGMIMFFVMTSMISDFSSVLLDIRESNILYPKPIKKKTISAAKFVHIVIYLSMLTGALAGPSLVAGLFKNGIVFFFVGIINIILIDLFIIALTALIYMMILRFFDGEKLKDVINYVQIGLTLAIMIGYQLLVRSFELVDLSVNLEPAWWQILVFPIWYGVIMEIVMNGSFHPFFLFLAGLGIIIPIIAIWIYVRLTPAFERNLQKLSQHGKARKEKRSKMGESLVRFISPSDEERVFFRFARLMLKNEREFKLRVYPALGFSAIFPFIFIMTSMDGFTWESLAAIREGKSYLYLYFSLIMIPTIITTLQYSGKYKGAWIYKATPIDSLKPIFSGTMKAFIVSLYLPVFVTLSVAFVAIFGVRILPDLILIFVNAVIYALICFTALGKSIPFSRSLQTYNQGNGVIIFLLILLVGLFAGIHFASTFFAYGLYIYLALAVLLLIILWKTVFKVGWEKIS